MARAHADGRLVELRRFEELPDRRVQVTAVLRELEPPRVRRRRQVWLVTCGALVAVGVLMVLAWLVVQLVLVVVATVTAAAVWVKTHLLLIVVVAVLVLFLLVGYSARAKCAGLHCGGCRG